VRVDPDGIHMVGSNLHSVSMVAVQYPAHAAPPNPDQIKRWCLLVADGNQQLVRERLAWGVTAHSIEPELPDRALSLPDLFIAMF